MADLKISQFDDGGAIQETDEIATNRGGVNTKVFVGSAAALDVGSGVGDIVVFDDDGSGNASYPSADGSQITNITNVGTNVIQNDMIRQSNGLSVIGNPTNSTADVDDITASLDNTVLRRSGTSLGFGLINAAASLTGMTPVVNGGTGRDSHTAYAVICGGTTTTGAQQSIASVGTSGQVLTSNGAGALPTFQAGGKVLQVSWAEVTSGASTTGTIPLDNTIPQIGEGAEALTLAYTPISSTSTLYIETLLVLSQNGTRSVISSLFVDSTADALSAVAGYIPAADFFTFLHLKYSVVSGSTTARTYRARYGAPTGTTYLNRNSTVNPLFGTVCRSFIRVTEVAA